MRIIYYVVGSNTPIVDDEPIYSSAIKWNL